MSFEVTFEEFKAFAKPTVDIRRVNTLIDNGFMDLIALDLFIDHVNPVLDSYKGDGMNYICGDKEGLKSVMDFIEMFKPNLLPFFEMEKIPTEQEVRAALLLQATKVKEFLTDADIETDALEHNIIYGQAFNLHYNQSWGTFEVCESSISKAIDRIIDAKHTNLKIFVDTSLGEIIPPLNEFFEQKFGIIIHGLSV